jgi:NAD(P)-dependent dehydrogenase (short-subunit alcohol dehydrogenase family)
MPDRIRLDGKVAVVTGAAGVIGSATAQLLAERGARIVAVDRKAADLKAAMADLPASADALAVTADVTGEDEVADYVRAAIEKFGVIDVFYNNAGIEGDIAPITKYSLATFRRVLDVNVVGVFLGLKHVLPVMLKQNRGSIINTASIAGLIGSPDIAVYSASKHAVIGLTKSAALECAGSAVRGLCPDRGRRSLARRRRRIRQAPETGRRCRNLQAFSRPIPRLLHHGQIAAAGQCRGRRHRQLAERAELEPFPFRLNRNGALDS